MTPQPSRSDFPSELDYCRAMQRWAAEEVPSSNPQRRICIDDWFAEELLIASGSEVVALAPSAVCARRIE